MNNFENWWWEQSLYIQENVNKKALELAYTGGRKDSLEWVYNYLKRMSLKLTLRDLIKKELRNLNE